MVCDMEVPGTDEWDGTEGLDDMPLSDVNEGLSDNEGAAENEGSDNNECDIDQHGMVVESNVEDGGYNFKEEYAVNGVEDLRKFELKNMTVEDMMRIHFPNLEVAFMFYNWYGSVNGFSGRKSKLLWNCNGEMYQQTFVCHKEGKRVEKNDTTGRKKEPKPTTRCGCKARCKVHIEAISGRWYIKYFNDVHNHKLMADKYSVMLPAHRNMSEYDISQMETMRKVGISTPHIYGVFATQAGGYERVGFLKNDMYFEQFRHRRPEFSDAKATLDFLEEMQKRDEMLFWRNTVDAEGRLEHLFWCDGVGRRDFTVFGDVLAFDATYRKNKYLCPLVVFSGVNHHNMSVVFAAAIVANETEETYVWVLQQFIEAMGGKSPVSVITDGDLAMRNAIKKVLPNAHHRLCAWHLIRNATSNVKNPRFVSSFKQCMLGDLDVDEFNLKWDKMVSDLGLEDNLWVLEMYQKRRMWATAYIRGNFFAGFRTTSRCEGLHSQFARYVNIKNNLNEFLQHFFRWMDYMRYKEVEADFRSIHGDPVFQTPFHHLESSAAHVYTKEVFMLFRPVLQKAGTCGAVVEHCDGTSFIYKVTRYRKEGFEWRVTFCQSSLKFKCTCLRLESLGIPCEHILVVLVSLNIARLPETIVLKRWAKSAKESLTGFNSANAYSRNPNLWCQYVGLIENCKCMAKYAYDCGSEEWMRKTIDMVAKHTDTLKAVARGERVTTPTVDGSVRDPARVRRKGSGRAPSTSQAEVRKKTQRVPTCGVCGGRGHKRQSCPVQIELSLAAQTQVDAADFEEFEFANIDMGVG